MKTLRSMAGLALLMAAVVSLTPGSAGAQERPRRVLVISVPGVTWADLRDGSLPALRELLEDAAVADLAPRSVHHNSTPGDAYLTISGGTRAVGEEQVDGLQLEREEEVEGEPAEAVFERRTGARGDGEILAVGWPVLVKENRPQPYDVELGLLAETLLARDHAASVVANADGEEADRGARFQRQAALALVDGRGTLSGGAVGADLLEEDTSSPFGLRLSRQAVRAAFDEAWGDAEDGGVVLVEASDLARAIRYRPLVAPERYDELRAETYARTDAMLSELLGEVDLSEDAVLVVAPYLGPGARGLTVAGLAGPGVRGGYLRSASTQRAGIVSLVDVAPTILDQLGIPRPDSMEGRPFEVVASGDTFAEREARLVEIDDASLFRENLLFPTTLVLVLVFGGVAAATVAAVAGNWGARARRTISFVAVADIAALPASYVARGFPLEDVGVIGYWALLVVIALALAVAALAVGRALRSWVAPLAVVLAVDILVLVGDVLAGSELHLSAAFGYSPTGNSRLYGISNYSFGQLAAASCLLAAMLAWRWPARGGRLAAVGLLVAVLVVLGVPIWGSDVGGIIAFTPTILVFVALLFRLRISWRLVIAVGVLTVLAVVAFGFADLARPPQQRAHLGRLFERIGREGLQPLLSIMERKFLANLRVSTSSFWVAAIPIGVALWAFLRRWSERPLAAVHDRIPTLHAGLVAGVVAALLGSLVNDSGAIVGGVATLVLGASLAHLVLQPEPDGR